MHRDAATWLEAEQVAPADRRTEEVALLRYAGQGGELAVAWAGSVAAACANFAAAHQVQYGFTMQAPIKVVTLRVEATGILPPPVTQRLHPGPLPEPPRAMEVHFTGGTRLTPLYDRATLPAGGRIAGPAIIAQLDATTLLPPGWTAQVHQSGALLLERS